MRYPAEDCLPPPREPMCDLCGVQDMGGSLVDHWAECPRCGATFLACRVCGGHKATTRWAEEHRCEK